MQSHTLLRTPVGVVSSAVHTPIRALSRAARRFSHISIVLVASCLLAACSQSDVSEKTTHTETGHADRSAHGDETERAHVRLTAEEIQALGIKLATANSGTLTMNKTFPGEVRINQERYAHVVARVAGVAASVAASVGETVKAGETLAVLESRELAETTAAYLGAREHYQLARDHFERMDRLYDKGIATEREHLKARQALAEAQIDTQAAEHGLRALGFSESWVEDLPQAPESARFRYPLAAPINGVVISRHLTRGESVAAETEAFAIADLSKVWVEFSIFPQDMARVREGQSVTVSAGSHSTTGTISYVRPIVSESTRAALARVVLPNPDGRWKPGMFVNGIIALDRIEAPVVIPQTALQTVDGQSVVFVKTEEGFRPQPVIVAAEGAARVAIKQGLEAGQTYVSQGAFTLKAELAKGSFEAGHSH